jgi:hypothetical protein
MNLTLVTKSSLTYPLLTPRSPEPLRGYLTLSPPRLWKPMKNLKTNKLEK